MKTTHLVIFEMENGKRRELHTTVLRPEPSFDDAAKICAVMLKAVREVDDSALPHLHHD